MTGHAERLACPLGGLHGSELRTAQAGVEVDAEDRQRAAGGVGMHRAALGERALVVRQAVFRFGVSQKPEHADNSSGSGNFAGKRAAVTVRRTLIPMTEAAVRRW